VLDRITPERFVKWTAEVVFDPDTIGEALSDPESIFVLDGLGFFSAGCAPFRGNAFQRP